MIEGLQIGRIVHYVMSGVVYPAIVVRVWDTETGCCNLQVFTDGNAVDWVTSRLYSESGEVGTWHWPPRS